MYIPNYAIAPPGYTANESLGSLSGAYTDTSGGLLETTWEWSIVRE